MKTNIFRKLFGMQPKFGAVGNYSVSVIVPAYNEAKSIGETIDSLRNQSVKIDEIIVVDDYSSDNTSEIARAKGVTVIRTPSNQGTKAMAQNFAVPYVKTDLVATIDADTTLHKDAIKNTLKYFGDEKTASVCGYVIPRHIKSIWERGRFIEYVFGITLMKSAQDNVGSVMVSSGCFSIFRTKLLKLLGGFKPRTMAEDMDLTWEFHFKGYHIYLAPNAYCYPIDPNTFDIYKKQINRWYASFFQNISIHWRSLLRDRLGMFIFFYLIDAILLPIISFIIMLRITHSSLYAIIGTALIEFFIIAIPCLLKGYKIKMFWKVCASIPANFMLRPINVFMFYKCMYNEWFGNNKLTTWEKGH